MTLIIIPILATLAVIFLSIILLLVADNMKDEVVFSIISAVCIFIVVWAVWRHDYRAEFDKVSKELSACLSQCKGE